MMHCKHFTTFKHEQGHSLLYQQLRELKITGITITISIMTVHVIISL